MRHHVQGTLPLGATDAWPILAATSLPVPGRLPTTRVGGGIGLPASLPCGDPLPAFGGPARPGRFEREVAAITALVPGASRPEFLHGFFSAWCRLRRPPDPFPKTTRSAIPTFLLAPGRAVMRGYASAGAGGGKRPPARPAP
jgi:hypothetical protein